MMKKTTFLPLRRSHFSFAGYYFVEKNPNDKKKKGHKSHLQSCVLMYTHLEAISLNPAIHTYQDEAEAEN